jgi:peroxiredoxin
MIRIGLLIATIGLGLFGSPALAGKYNRVLDIGDAAPTWEKLPGVDGKLHSSELWDSKKVLVVVFTCNSCPYAVDAEDRLIALHKKYAGPEVALVAINVNKVEEDLLPAMKEKAQEKGFPFPYLFDETQQIAKQFGARVTPECYVLDRDRKVRYMGSIDDSPDGRDITVKYLENAIDSVLADETPNVTETVPIGCRVRYERDRSSRRRRKAAAE